MLSIFLLKYYVGKPPFDARSLIVGPLHDLYFDYDLIFTVGLDSSLLRNGDGYPFQKA